MRDIWTKTGENVPMSLCPNLGYLLTKHHLNSRAFRDIHWYTVRKNVPMSLRKSFSLANSIIVIEFSTAHIIRMSLTHTLSVVQINHSCIYSYDTLPRKSTWDISCVVPTVRFLSMSHVPRHRSWYVHPRIVSGSEPPNTPPGSRLTPPSELVRGCPYRLSDPPKKSRNQECKELVTTPKRMKSYG